MRLVHSVLSAVVIASVAVAQEPTQIFIPESTPPAGATQANTTELSECGWRLPWDSEPPNSPFREGSWVSMGYISGSFGIFADDARIYGAHGGVGHYFRDNVSFN